MGEAQADDLEGGFRERSADRNLVQADAVVTFQAEPVIAGEKQDEAAGDGVTPHYGDSWFGEAEEVQQAVAQRKEGVARSARRTERLKVDAATEVEAGAEEAPLASENDSAHRVVVAGRVERTGETVQERRRDGVRRRAVEGEQPDACFAVFAAYGGHANG